MSKADKLRSAMTQNTAVHTAAVSKAYAGSATVGEKFELIACDNIRPGKYQPRLVFDNDQQAELTASVAENSLIQPIRVRPIPGEPGFFELIAGERRWRSAKAAGKTHVHAVVSVINDEQAARYSLSENLDRVDLSDFEVARAIKRYESEFGANYGTKSELIKKLNLPRSEFYRYMAFFDLPAALLEKLGGDPSFLGRKAAEMIASVVKKNADSPVLEKAVDSLVESLALGTVSQLDAPDFLTHALENPDSVGTATDKDPSAAPTDLDSGDRKVNPAPRAAAAIQKEQIASKSGIKFGKWSRSVKRLTIDLDVKKLDERKEAALREFVTKLLDD